MNLYLVGYRCTGKTSIGARLAERLGWNLVDTDARIVEEAGMSIAELVSGQGWDAFRQKEALLLKKISSGDNQVVSTGGGLVLHPENRRRIRQSGLTVWLTAKPATIMRRMSVDSRNRESRPALTDKNLEEEIRDTLVERIPLYAQTSDLAVATDYFSIEDACQAIIEWAGFQGVKVEG